MEPTIRVIMLRTAMGAPDSTTVVEYQAGRQYDLPQSLADCFFSTGDADPAEAHEAPAAVTVPAKPAARTPAKPKGKRG